MELSVFAKLWQQKHPGSIVQKAKGGITLTYSDDSKMYTYKGSNYSIAERLDIIPEVDYFQEASIINRKLAAGEKEVIAPAGCLDTCKYTWNGAINSTTIICQDAGYDKYGRKQSVYSIQKIEDNPWL